MIELEALSRVVDQADDPENPDAEELRRILSDVESIAVVGMSRDPRKAARRVPSYLAAKGYRIIPVNPHANRILGQEVRASLADVDESVDMVLLFRPSEEVGAYVLEAARRPEEPVIWLQEGIRDDEAATEARQLGRTVVQNLCAFKAHRVLEPS